MRCNSASNELKKRKYVLSDMQKLDVLIIGGGPIGLACGIQAEKNNLNYLIIEKGTLVNSLYNYPVNMTFFSTSEKLEIGGVPFMSINKQPTRPEALEYYRRVAEHYDLKINLYEEVKNLKKCGDDFLIDTSKATYQVEKVVIATG